MRRYDLTPLFRTTVGFDRWNDLFNAAFRADESVASYPPYNIEKVGDDSYRVTLAVAGFGADDLNVTARESLLVISGKLAETSGNGADYLYRGVAARAFDRRFSLADHVKIIGSSLANGLLEVDLTRELPEAMQPRTIAIETKRASKRKAIEGRKAA